MVQDEKSVIDRICNEITDEILRDERWLAKMKGCPPAFAYPRINAEWIDNHMGEIQSGIAHDLARLEHFRRVRGYNG